MHQKELKIVRFAMVVLFSALMVVYLLLYQIKGDNIIEQLSLKNIDENQLTSNNIDLYEDLDEIEEIYIQENSEIDDKNSETKKVGSMFEGVDGLDVSNNETTSKITVLSGTSLWYGRVESVEKLGISYQYALRDQKNIYYVFLDPKRYMFDDIVRKLGGTTYTMNTEKEIMENKLFGDKITFINLSEYQEKFVIILVEINNYLWLLQIDYPVYHKSKGYIKTLFIE